MSKKRILLWGGKSKARIIEAMLLEDNQAVDFIFDPFLDQVPFETRAHFGNDSEHLRSFLDAATHFVVCIGGDHGYERVHISRFLEEKIGLLPLDVISPRAIIDTGCSLGKGTQVMPGAVIHKFCFIGDYVCINTNATVDHECVIGSGVHVMGGASVTGCVTIEDYAAVGTNATILPNITIGEGAIIGAGAVVTKNVPAKAVVVGNPARVMRNRELSVDLDILTDALR